MTSKPNIVAKLKIEGLIFAALFIISFIFNIVALHQSQENWIKVFSELHKVAGLALLFYVAVGMIRLIPRFLKRAIKSFDEYSKPEDF